MIITGPFLVFLCVVLGAKSLRGAPARLPCPWASPGKNTGAGCHVLLQEIFPTQGSNPRLLCLLHWQVGFLPLGLPYPVGHGTCV